jgi:hypothetical protein
LQQHQAVVRLSAAAALSLQDLLLPLSLLQLVVGKVTQQSRLSILLL